MASLFFEISSFVLLSKSFYRGNFSFLTLLRSIRSCSHPIKSTFISFRSHAQYFYLRLMPVTSRLNLMNSFNGDSRNYPRMIATCRRIHAEYPWLDTIALWSSGITEILTKLSRKPLKIVTKDLWPFRLRQKKTHQTFQNHNFCVV